MKSFGLAKIAAIMGLSLSIASISAQPLTQEFRLLSPNSSELVISGKLLIVIKLPENHKSKPTDYILLLDGKTDIAQNIVIRKNIMSVIYNGALESGSHSFELFTKPTDSVEQKRQFLSYFNVAETSAALPIAEVKPKKKKTPPVKPPLISGRVTLSTADAAVTGLGARLRQEPPVVREVGMDVKIRAGKGFIPISGFYTTNSQGDFNYRNRFKIGYQQGEFSLTLGDHFINADRYTFNGIRLRGINLNWNLTGNTYVKLMYGRSVDMLSTPNSFPVLPSSSDDIYQYGIPKYERDYFLFQVMLKHTKHAYGKFSIVRVRDYLNANQEFIPGLNPQDNFSLSWEKYIPIVKNRGYIRLNAAMAFTTLNNTLGGFKWDGLIRMNASTVPLSFKGAPQTAFTFAMSLPITKANDFIVDAKRIGHSFYALANPYLLNNRYVVHVSDRLKLFENKLFLNLNYDYMKDNLGGQQFFTRENSSLGASFSLRLKENLPSVTIGYRWFLGNTYSDLAQNNNIENTSLFGSIQYRLKIDPITVQFSVSRNDLNLISAVMANNRQLVNSINMSVIYKSTAGLGFQGAQTTHYLSGRELPQEMLSANVWYRIKKPGIRFQIRALTNTITLEDLGNENRQGYQASVDYRWRKYINFSITAGHLPFTSYTEERSYLERFIRFRCTFMF